MHFISAADSVHSVGFLTRRRRLRRRRGEDARGKENERGVFHTRSIAREKMGRGRFNKRRNGGGGGGRGGAFARDFKRQKRDDGNRDNKYGKTSFDDIVKTNETFEAYYKAQKIVPEDEWETFLETLRTPLPMTFRINGSGKFATDMRDNMEGKLFADLMAKASEDDELREIPPPTPLAWYPDRLAWQCSYTRAQLRRMPVLQGIFDFIKNANELGSISRQEAVSMIPPFFLAAKPHHRILDMCASPGSKTFQILERMHGDFDSNGQALPTGFVVANDVDLKRCNLLTHQTKRANSPTLLVTNHEAQKFPIITGPNGEKFDFDAILCDVPCSGDATMRKAPDIWNRWVAGNGNGLHSLQLKIALRGAQLLKIGGRLVYSTCSLNPIENEAVVAALLKECKGALELLDVSDELPNLKRSPGLHEWQVWDKFGYHPSFDGEEQMHKLSATMFSDEETKKLPLERCMRLLPHHQDTGGFFVAVFEKKADMEVPVEHTGKQMATPKERLKLSINVGTDGNCSLSYETFTITRASKAVPPIVNADGEYLLPHRGAKGPNGGGRWLGIDPVLPVNDPKVINSIFNVYGIQASDIALDKNCVTRTSDTSRPKRVYTITDSLREYLACDTQEALRVTSCGLKAFERQEIKDSESSGGSICDFRLTQDGLPMIFPFVRKRIVRPTFEEYKKILERRTIAFEYSAEAPERAVVADEATKKALLDLALGCCILIPRDEDLAAINVSKLDLAIACWRGRTSCNLLVSKAETVHFIDKLKAATSSTTEDAPMES